MNKYNFLFIISESYKTMQTERLEKIIFKRLNNDIELLYFVNKEFSYSSYDSKFTKFMSAVLDKIHPSEHDVFNTIYKILIRIQKENPSQSLLNCAVSLHEEFGFCVIDISEMIKQRNDLLYAITENFKDKKMFKDSFLLSYFNTNIDTLEW